MKIPFSISLATLSFGWIYAVPARAQELPKPRIAATIAVATVVEVPTTKAIPILIQVEGLDGEKVPDKVYIRSLKGTFSETNQAFSPVPLINGYGRVVLNLWETSQYDRARDTSGTNRITLYLAEDQRVQLVDVKMEIKQQALIHLLGVKGATPQLNDSRKWTIKANGQNTAQIRYRIEDEQGKPLSNVPFLLRIFGTFTDRSKTPEFSSGVTDEKGEIVIPIPHQNQEGTLIYQVLSEYLTSAQTLIEYEK